MTNMEVASYLGLVNLALAQTKQIKKDEDDVTTDKMLEAIRISQLYFYQQAMDELKGMIKND